MKRNGVSSGLFDPESPHFFKIMLASNIRAGKLSIPKKFVRKYGSCLSKSKTATLKVPSGDVWKVELGKADDGTVWLEKGWQDFLSFFSVKHGDFLVFRQSLADKSNVLHVMLFDKTCTEIEYPVKTRNNLSLIKLENASDEDGVVLIETRDGQPSRRTARSANRSSILQTHLKAELEAKESSKKKKGSPIPSRKRTRGYLKGAEKIKALERTESFKSSRPYFRVVMQPSYVSSTYQLNLPGKFILKYLGQKKSGEMKLVISGEKVWTMPYIIRTNGARVVAKVFVGWKKFALDNDLVLGDICIFELLRGVRRTSFNVTIFRRPPLKRSRGIARQAAPVLSKLEVCSEAKSKGKEKLSYDEMARDELIKQKVAKDYM